MKPDFTKITEYISKKGKTNIFYHLTSFSIILKIFANAYRMRTQYANKGGENNEHTWTP